MSPCIQGSYEVLYCCALKEMSGPFASTVELAVALGFIFLWKAWDLG